MKLCTHPHATIKMIGNFYNREKLRLEQPLHVKSKRFINIYTYTQICIHTDTHANIEYENKFIYTQIKKHIKIYESICN